ncbi:hypothetical protein WEB32_28505 [Streptomyces netropsis]|uniref:Uncharacterized protein n=1 Tax=Streptomyces netropsis TaxID=55404 RepID=A0A7W7LGH9_STRNE|nr:hypothetical protein [Streptomyces netropsis]MBB4889507.1 hypothetical protein [Streptomyces netropsis]GGR40548.1 hypothetical protein GCM10010219_52350 [Streptomyces netropsis]
MKAIDLRENRTVAARPRKAALRAVAPEPARCAVLVVADARPALRHVRCPPGRRRPVLRRPIGARALPTGTATPTACGGGTGRDGYAHAVGAGTAGIETPGT